MDNQYDTIAAIATPLGMGGIGIIRLSGANALTILKTLSPSQKQISPRYVYFSDIINPKTQSKLDEACLIYYKSPQSYTGEDVVEIQSHSSPFILKSILLAVLSAGARQALKGEFTKRAFLNGKVNLEKAESIIDLIHATHQKSHAVALTHVEGKLSKLMIEVRKENMLFLEQIEASIDFPDEVDPIDRELFLLALKKKRSILDRIIKLQDFGQQIMAGVKCLIIGKPNVGKSSLLNAFVGKDRAIVTNIPGTTRDFIEAKIELGGVLFECIDTAGIRDNASDYIERLGMKKIQQLLDTAHVVFFVVDGSEELEDADYHVFQQVKHKKCLYIIKNKQDKCVKKDVLGSLSLSPSIPIVSISAETGAGMEDIKQLLRQDFVSKIEGVELELICNVRQITVIETLITIIDQLIMGIQNGYEDDMLSIDLRQMVLKCGELTGDDLTEEMLDNIFDRFCIGK